MRLPPDGPAPDAITAARQSMFKPEIPLTGAHATLILDEPELSSSLPAVMTKYGGTTSDHIEHGAR